MGCRKDNWDRERLGFESLYYVLEFSSQTTTPPVARHGIHSLNAATLKKPSGQHTEHLYTPLPSQHHLQRILHRPLQLPDPLPAHRAIHNLMIEARRNHNLLIPLHALLPLHPLRHRHLPCRAHRQDARLRRVDHRREALHRGVHAHVADRERPALVLLRLEFPVAGARAQVFDGGGDAFQAEGVDVADDGRHEPDGGGDGDGDVDGVVLPDDDLVVDLAPGGVDGGDLGAGDGAGFDEEVIEAELVGAGGGGVERLPELEELGDGEGGGDEVVRVLVHGLGEAVGDRFAHRGGGDVFVGGGRSGGAGGGGGLEFLDVGSGDASAGAGALDLGNGDALFKGEGFGGGASVGLTFEGSLEATACGTGLLRFRGGCWF